MSGADYFDASDYDVVNGTRTDASDINTMASAVETGFGKLPSESDLKLGKINYALDTGIADAYVVSLTYTPSGLTDGMQVVFKATAANTGGCTINVNGLGATIIKRQDGSTPIAGDIAANKITELRYNTTSGYFEIQGSIGAQAGSGTMASQNASSVSITGGTIGTATVAEVQKAAASIANPPIAGDATPGRVLRMAELTIENGTNAQTLKCTLASLFNGDAISETDNITGDVGDWYYDGSSFLRIDGVANVPLAVIGTITLNLSATAITCYASVSSSVIGLNFYNAATGAGVDLDVLVDTGNIYVQLFYITSS